MADFSILFRALATLAVAQASIHPDGHFDRCTALTPESDSILERGCRGCVVRIDDSNLITFLKPKGHCRRDLDA